MTAHPQEKQERCDFLCREIDRLILRHKVMPTDDLRERVDAQIKSHLREIDALNLEMEEEQRAAQRAAEVAAEPAPPGYFSTTPGIYQAMGVGLIFAVLGLIFGMYLMVFFGGVIVLASITSWMRPSPEPQKAPPQVIGRKRREWTP